jgi:hypothetical protein
MILSHFYDFILVMLLVLARFFNSTKPAGLLMHILLNRLQWHKQVVDLATTKDSILVTLVNRWGLFADF